MLPAVGIDVRINKYELENTEGSGRGLIWSASLAFASGDVNEDSQSLSEVCTLDL